MTTALVASLIAVLVLGFVEGLRGLYPSRSTWQRLRRTKGRLAVRLIRERYEAAAERGRPRLVLELLACLVILWIAVASLLDKRWYEVVSDILPYLIVGAALFRLPGALRAIGERMKTYERDAGEDPDEDWREGGDGGPTAIAL